MARRRRARGTARRKKRPKPKRKAKPRPKPLRKPRPKGKARPSRRPAPTIVKVAKPRASAVRTLREELEEQTVCSLEFLSDGRSFIARLETARGGMREHRAPSFTDLLELVSEDLREEFLEG